MAKKDIIITHFVNPHMFWFRVENDFFGEKSRKEMEDEMGNQVSLLPQYEPKIGDKVAVYKENDKRWIRAVVDQIYEFRTKEYVLWEIDYGLPLLSKSDSIRKLPNVFAEIKSNVIKFGGLNEIVPGQWTYDPKEGKTMVKMVETWADSATNYITKILDNTFSCVFVIDAEYNNQFFGQIQITTNLKQDINLQEKLIELSYGVLEKDDFFKIFKKLNLGKTERWLDAKKNCTLFKYNNNVRNTITMTSPLTKTKLDDENYGEKFDDDEMFTKNKNISITKKIDEWNKINDDYLSAHSNEALIDLTSINIEKKLYDIESVSVIGQDRTLNSIRNLKFDNERESSKSPPCLGDLENNLKILVIEDKITESKKNVDDLTVPPKNIEKEKSRDANDKKSVVSIGCTSNRLSSSQLKRLMMSETPQRIRCPGGFDISKLKSPTAIKNDISERFLRVKERKSEYAKMMQEENNRSNENVIDLLDTVVEPDESKFLVKPIDAKTITWKPDSESIRLKSNKMETNNWSSSVKNHLQMLQSAQHIKPVEQKLEKIKEPCLRTNTLKDYVLVHGIVPTPIDKFSEANFSSIVLNGMELLSYNKIYRIQRYTWPHLNLNNSMIVVSGKDTGKTLSYLPSICSLIQKAKDDQEIKKGIGPIGIIIVPYPKEAIYLSNICSKLVSSCINNNDSMKNLLNGPDLLICTPNVIEKILKDEMKYLNKDRLKHITIENIDSWDSEMINALKEILKKFKFQNIQLIITSRTWCSLIEKLIKKEKIFNNLMICIGSYIEAAVYAKTNFNLKIEHEANKVKSILQFIAKHPYDQERLVIVCNTPNEVTTITSALDELSYDYDDCSEESSDKIVHISQKWQGPSKFILICTDKIISDLKIQNAQNLIHYSLSSTWSHTCYRFSMLLKTFNDRINKSNQDLQTNTLFLLDANNTEQLPKLINFLEYINIKIAPEIKTTAKNIQIEREKNYTLCQRWLEFNKIHDATECKQRHWLKVNDLPSINTPTEGVVKLEIIAIESPVHYRARLLMQQLPGNSWQEIRKSSKYTEFEIEFQNYFLDTTNHKKFQPIILDNYCVVKEISSGVQNYYRAKIIQIDTKRNVQINAIDTAEIKWVEADQLLVLPEKFTDFPPQAIHLYLSDIVPYHKDEFWNVKSASELKEKWLAKQNYDRVLAYINYSLADIIFAKEILLESYLPSILTHVEKLSLRKYLLDNNIGRRSDKIVLKKFNDANSLVKQLSELNHVCNNNIDESMASLIQFSSSSESEECVEPDSTQTNICIKDENCLKELPMTNSTDRSQKIDKTPIKCNEKKDHVPVTISNDYGEKIDQNSEKDELFLNFSGDNTKTPLLSNLDTFRTRPSLASTPKKNIYKVEDNWEILNDNDFTRISISSFNSPRDFYVNNKEIQGKEEIYKKIDEFIDNGAEKIHIPAVGLNCLANFDGYYERCKITELSWDSTGNSLALVFFVDIGNFCTIPVENLRTTNNEIINLMPFQAIHCNLIGVLPLKGNWTEENTEDIFNLIANNNNLYVHKQTMETRKENNHKILKYWKYDIILIDSSAGVDVQINGKIIDLGYGIRDSETGHYLDEISLNISNSESKTNTDWLNYEDFEDNYEDDLEFFNELMSQNKRKSIEAVETMDENETNIENSQKNIEDISEVENENDSSIVNEMSDMPKIKALYNSCNVDWKQSEHLIILNIHAPDITDYYLQVSNFNLVFGTYINFELHVTNINFFAMVDYSLTSHELRGLNVIVRLVKRLKGKAYQWPRLCAESDKHNWLKYNLDEIVIDAEHKIKNVGVDKKSYGNVNLCVDNFQPDDESSIDGSNDESENEYDDIF